MPAPGRILGADHRVGVQQKRREQGANIPVPAELRMQLVPQLEPVPSARGKLHKHSQQKGRTGSVHRRAATPQIQKSEPIKRDRLLPFRRGFLLPDRDHLPKKRSGPSKNSLACLLLVIGEASDVGIAKVINNIEP